MNSVSTSRQVLLALIGICVGLAGCGKNSATTQASEDMTSSSTPTTTAPTTTAQPTTTDAPASTTPSTAAPISTAPSTTDAPTTSTPSTTALEPTAAPRAGDEYRINESGLSYAAFKSPSGGITCEIGDDSADCVVLQNTWVMPPNENCPATWGGPVQVGTGKATHVCRGDPTRDGPVLPYGHEIEQGPFLCRSEESGVTCDNQETGHGFKVNRASFDLY